MAVEANELAVYDLQHACEEPSPEGLLMLVTSGRGEGQRSGLDVRGGRLVADVEVPDDDEEPLPRRLFGPRVESGPLVTNLVPFQSHPNRDCGRL